MLATRLHLAGLGTMLTDVSKAVNPLRLIFWGYIINAFDFTIGTRGFKFDIVHDTIGVLLIVFGVFTLADFEVNPQYTRFLTYSKYAAVTMAIVSLGWGFTLPALLEGIGEIAELLTVIITYFFCRAMIWFCKRYNLQLSAASWNKTQQFWLYLYMLPYMFMYVAASLIGLPHEPIRVTSGGWVFIASAILAFPFIHLLLSLWRTAQEASRPLRTDKDVTDDELLQGFLEQG